MVRKGLNRKGLSDIVVTVLIILLVVAAVAIIWGFISTFLRSTDKIDTNTLNTVLSIQPKSVIIKWNGTVLFNAKMDSGGSVGGVQITLYDNSGNAKMIYKNVSFYKLQLRSFYIEGEEHGLANIVKIEIAPMIETKTGLQVGTMRREYNVNPLDVNTDRCGDGKINSSAGEECDNGIDNGDVVLRESVSYNGNVVYCTNDTSNLPLKACKLVSVVGPFCGDNIIDNSSNSIGGNEQQCDTNNISTTCQAFTKYKYGNLACSGCQLNTTNCIPSQSLSIRGYYKFEENSGSNVIDSSGNGNLAELKLNPVRTTGKLGNGIYIKDGAYFDTKLNLNTSNNFTVVLWAKFEKCTSTECYFLVDSGNLRGLEVILTTSDSIRMQSRNSDGNFGYSTSYVNGLSIGQWLFLDLRYNGNTKLLKLRVNDNDAMSSSSSLGGGGYTGLNDIEGLLKMGVNYYNANSGTKLILDEVGVWNRTLSNAEITEIYNQLS